ncbi:hypothetical protein HPB47_008060 [Ixodes persulcatus]|uniref:Uncharacterized protein n=1 Tax=Ixodes persulcatus TaxID=34615 RepID=A0AC60P655_IXOPE|nr:hypothetical protein HPB47_008060 [Ixodes persulcatus]
MLSLLEDHTGQVLHDFAGHLPEHLTILFGSRDPYTPMVPQAPETPARIPNELTEPDRPQTPGQPGDLKWEVKKISLDGAIAHVKKHTARGKDGISAALAKCMGEETGAQLASILPDIVSGSPVLDDWMQYFCQNEEATRSDWRTIDLSL